MYIKAGVGRVAGGVKRWLWRGWGVGDLEGSGGRGVYAELSLGGKVAR